MADPTLRNSIDCLHLLEYYTYAYPRSRFMEKLEGLAEGLVEGAITLAKIIETVDDSVVRKYYGGVIE